MQNSYSIQELIDALDDVINTATPVPFGKKSMVDVGQISDIISDMRMALPMEIRQAQKVVDDKNNIIRDAEREAESIIRKAEERRRELIDESDILKEARRRATEVLGSAEARCSDLRASTDAFADKMLMRVEELLQKDLNDLRILRQNIAMPVSQQVFVQPPEKPGN
ncbi:MAG: ATPase [Oscillospiraceae bacterium]|nr:ATPase [Oscillospiraceae bacterium]